MRKNKLKLKQKIKIDQIKPRDSLEMEDEAKL